MKRSSVFALILAAGQSKRMGQPKVLLPWGKSTVLQTVVSAFRAADVDEIIVVTGALHEEISALIGGAAQAVFNSEYASGEMLSSIQRGLRYMLSEKAKAEGVLIGLGDQPQVQTQSVEAVSAAFRQGGAGLVVPSYQKRRGHPWLAARPLWEPLLALGPSQTPRDFLNAHADQIHYVDVDTPSILADLDTPEEYQKSKPA
jgi:molybdenum cofactor cytidylyltransferase